MTSLFALLDDILAVLDDVAALTKVAAKKSAGMMTDELALNSRQVAGFAAERELPVVWAVAKGSLKNKAILAPAALALTAVAPWAITALLVCGGLYLCYEGFEALAHKLRPHAEDEKHRGEAARAAADPAVDLVAFEKEKIAGAIRTDFVLSAEVIIISLASAAAQPLVVRAGVVAGVGLIMTVVIYGLVAGIVKLDDAGLRLMRSARTEAFGRFLVRAAPVLMRGLSVLGTAAMFLVGGGILSHAIFHAEHGSHVDGLIGVVAGAAVWAALNGARRLRKRA